MLKVLKIITVVLAVLIIVVLGFPKVYDYIRIFNITGSIIGTKNIKFIDSIDQELLTGIDGSIETYVYKIKNINQVNCNNLKKYNDKKLGFIDSFQKKYINFDKKIDCSKYTIDKYNRTIYMVIQGDILLVQVL